MITSIPFTENFLHLVLKRLRFYDDVLNCKFINVFWVWTAKVRKVSDNIHECSYQFPLRAYNKRYLNICTHHYKCLLRFLFTLFVTDVSTSLRKKFNYQYNNVLNTAHKFIEIPYKSINTQVVCSFIIDNLQW